MLKRISALALLGLGLASMAAAQVPVQPKTAILADRWDLDGEAADDDQVVIVGNGALTDSKTFTITAQPDSPRLIKITVTDADSSISAGALTIVGTDGLGLAKTCSFTFAAGGSGVKTLTCTDGRGAYFSNITSITTGALTGEGGADTVIVGYTDNSQTGWPIYGVLKPAGQSGERGVDPFAQVDSENLITTGGAYTTTVEAVGNNVAFTPIVAGDEIFAAGHWVKVMTKASNSSITVSDALTIANPGQRWSYKKFYFTENPAHEMVMDVRGYRTVKIDWAAANVAATGGLDMIIEGHDGNPGWPLNGWVTLCPVQGVACTVTHNVPTGTSQGWTSDMVDRTLANYPYLRVGFRFATGDDADGTPESISARVYLSGALDY